MGKRRQERDQVEKLLLENRRRKAYDIAEEVGLIETLGYDKAVDYVRQVRKSMRKAGTFPEEKYKYASEADRLDDINKLFELRQGKKIDKRVAHAMLLLNCYYRFKSEDDDIHWQAIDDTYAKNKALVEPLDMYIAIGICDLALLKYVESKDEEKIEAAKKRGFPGAGLNYTSSKLIEKLAITDEELQYMKSIKNG